MGQKIDERLLAAITAHDSDTAIQLLASGANVNYQDGKGEPILAIAAMLQLREVVKYLLEAGADPNLLSAVGQSALKYAAWHDDDMVQMLLEKGADPNSATVNGRTPLHSAVSFAEANNVQLLLDAQADCNKKDSLGRTPLMLAIERKQHEAVHPTRTIKQKQIYKQKYKRIIALLRNADVHG